MGCGRRQRREEGMWGRPGLLVIPYLKGSDIQRSLLFGDLLIMDHHYPTKTFFFYFI